MKQSCHVPWSGTETGGDLQKERGAEGLALWGLEPWLKAGDFTPFQKQSAPAFGVQRVFRGDLMPVRALFWHPAPEDAPEVLDFALVINTTHQYRVLMFIRS